MPGGIVMNHGSSPAAARYKVQLPLSLAIYCVKFRIIGGSDQIMARKTGTVRPMQAADITPACWRRIPGAVNLPASDPARRAAR
ncbi:hypothetical protein KCP78_16115 [Salmonella enterica subsp. enterica]|nr:hypothetical protein KCP78_16115 [Salmonella enterica subsp. enterica]